MSEFRLTIRTSGAAFTDESGEGYDLDARNYEVARLLRDVADGVEAGLLSHTTMSVFDYNGNRIGGYVHRDEDN